jgi:hypothetical protein
LFYSEPEFEVLHNPRKIHNWARHVAQQRPELIVASVKPVGAGLCATALALKQASPLSKLILICPVSQLVETARKCGADRCLDQEKLVGRLLPAAWTLSDAASSCPSVRKIPARVRVKNQTKKD